jgi:hypothetical protein
MVASGWMSRRKRAATSALGLPKGGVEGEGVAIDVGGAEFVEVDEGEMADGGAGEGFGGGGADGAKAGDDDAGVGERGRASGPRRSSRRAKGVVMGGNV